MDLEQLEELGLSQGEIKVYAAILNIGISNLAQIQEKTSIERRNIYDIITKLVDKGLISYTTQNKKKLYQCTHPSKLLDQINIKKQALLEIEKTIPEMINLYDIKKPEIKAEVLRGDQSIITLLSEMLKYNESYWLGGNSFESYKSVSKGLQLNFKKWMKQRVQKKHIMYDIVSHGTYLEGLEPNKKKEHKKQYYIYKELPEGMYTPMVLILFGNKVAQVLWKDQPFAFVIESEEIAQSYKKYMEYFLK
ncbi:MAG: helix-turn-helix domain-containing protein [Nanoarchaeota archaeon]|nr:helix-turn-helix domain-containing protein [Nanoarchaeota archaeon]